MFKKIKKNFWIRRISLNLLNTKLIISNPLYKWLFQRKINKCLKKTNSSPPTASIEITNRCNANCKICARHSMTRPLQIIDRKLFEKIVNDLVKMKVKKINLTGFGESLIDPDLANKVRYAKQTGIDYVCIITNGSLLAKDKQIDLMTAGIDEIRFSIDSLDEKEYQDNRKLDLKIVLENLESIIQLKKEQPECKTKVGITSVVYQKRSWKDIGQIYKKYKNKVDFITYQLSHDWIGANKDLKFAKTKKFIAKNVRLYPCPFLWYYLVIWSNGNISPCCLDYDNKMKMGNAAQQNLKNIWQGEIFQRIRKKHLARQANQIPPCQNCTFYPNWWMEK